MVVSSLRNELKARNVNYKGLKSQLVARLVKALKAEAESSDDVVKDAESEPEKEVEEKKPEVWKKKEN